MKVTLISIPVRDQEKALKFYTEKLGFIKKSVVNVSFTRMARWTRIIIRTGSESFRTL